MDFCKNFNAKTAKDDGLIIPVVVTVYSDRSYTFITKTPPAAVLLKRAANIAKGSGVPNKTKVGTVTGKQVEEIAKLKLPDLNTETVDAAVRIGSRHGAFDGSRRHRLDGWAGGWSGMVSRTGRGEDFRAGWPDGRMNDSLDGVWEARPAPFAPRR